MALSARQKTSGDKAIQELRQQVRELQLRLSGIPEIRVVKGRSGESVLEIKSGNVKRRVSLTTEDGKRRSIVQEDLDLKGRNIKNVGTVQAKKGVIDDI